MFLNKCSIKYLFIIPSLTTKYNFHCWNPVDPPLAESEVRQMLSWWRHIDKCSSSKYLLWRIYQAFTMHATVSNWHHLRSSTFLDNIKLFIDLFSQLVEYYYFYVTSQIQFLVNIRPRLLIACLNSAANRPPIPTETWA